MFTLNRDEGEDDDVGFKNIVELMDENEDWKGIYTRIFTNSYKYRVTYSYDFSEPLIMVKIDIAKKSRLLSLKDGSGSAFNIVMKFTLSYYEGRLFILLTLVANYFNDNGIIGLSKTLVNGMPIEIKGNAGCNLNDVDELIYSTLLGEVSSSAYNIVETILPEIKILLFTFVETNVRSGSCFITTNIITEFLSNNNNINNVVNNITDMVVQNAVSTYFIGNYEQIARLGWFYNFKQKSYDSFQIKVGNGIFVKPRITIRDNVPVLTMIISERLHEYSQPEDAGAHEMMLTALIMK